MVAIRGCGPVGQFAIQSELMFYPARVIEIDCVPERLAMAEKHGKCETIEFSQDNVFEVLQKKTKGRTPDRCIDAVYDKVKTALMMATDRAHALQL